MRIVVQNTAGIAIAKALGIEPIIGIMAGSVSMIGGLGTAGAFGPYYEQLLGIPGTASALAAATFGIGSWYDFRCSSRRTHHQNA